MLRTSILLALVPIVLGCTNPDSDVCASYISANAATASPFCATFTKSTITATTGLPSWATNCSNKPSLISKECSCYYTGGASGPTITTLKTSTTRGTSTTGTTTGSVVTTTAGGGVSSSCTSGYTIDQLVGYAAGTTGGGSGSVITVSTCTALEAALKVGGVIKISGTLNSCGVLRVPSDTSILGVGSTAGLTDGGFNVREATNVIIRNLKIQSPLGEDAIGVDDSTYVWVDHCDLHAVGLTGDKDDYDGLFDVKHGSDFITISWTYFHDHWKASLVGHSDSNSAEDTGKLHITYHHNWWYNINSRTPSIRFGTGHVYSSCYEEIPTSGVHARQGAKVRIEQNYFTDVHYAEITHLDSPIDGYIDDRNNILVNSDTLITQTTSLALPYSYIPTCAASVCAAVKAKAGVGIVTF